MCQCTPSLRTPFCGKPGCEWSQPPPRSADYGDACGAMRATFRLVLAERGHTIGHPQTEHLVEKLLAAIHDASIEWALRQIVDRPETRK